MAVFVKFRDAVQFGDGMVAHIADDKATISIDRPGRIVTISRLGLATVDVPFENVVFWRGEQLALALTPETVINRVQPRPGKGRS